MRQAVVKYAHDWENCLACKEHQHKLVFLDLNKEMNNWDKGELNDVAGNSENKPSTPNDFPSKLPVIDLETDYNDTSAVTPDIYQSNVECIQDARTNSILIPDWNIGRPAGVATVVD